MSTAPLWKFPTGYVHGQVVCIVETRTHATSLHIHPYFTLYCVYVNSMLHERSQEGAVTVGASHKHTVCKVCQQQAAKTPKLIPTFHTNTSSSRDECIARVNTAVTLLTKNSGAKIHFNLEVGSQEAVMTPSRSVYSRHTSPASPRAHSPHLVNGFCFRFY